MPATVTTTTSPWPSVPGTAAAFPTPAQDRTRSAASAADTRRPRLARPPDAPVRRSPGPSPSEPPEPGSGLSTPATASGRLRSWVTWWARTLPALPWPAR